MHSGSIQPQEKQAAAYRQPWQEDNNLSWMVRQYLELYFAVYLHLLYVICINIILQKEYHLNSIVY